MEKYLIKKNKSFTLVELIVTASIVVLIAGGAFLSMGTASDSTKISTNAEEVKTLLDELKSYAVGADRAMATYYFLIINRDNRTGSGIPVCNRYISETNHLKDKGDYIICSSPSEDIINYTNSGCANCFSSRLSKVKGGHIDREINLTGISGNTSTADLLVFVVRTYDGQIGMSSGEYSTDPDGSGPLVINRFIRFVDAENSTQRLNNTQINMTIEKTGVAFKKYIHINPLINTIWLNEKAS